MIYNAGIVGCGRIGFSFDKDPKRGYIATHAGAYDFVKATKLTAVCDCDEKRLNECINKFPAATGYTNVRTMLKKEKIDILSICTPPKTHYHILKEAVKFPLRAIFCEKPIADNTKDAERMIRLCKEKNIILQIDHQRRFDLLHRKLKEFIKNKKLGDVQQVNFYYTAGINNTGSHMFDLLRFFFGNIDWVEGFFSKNASNREGDPNIDGILKFENGIFATFQACDVTKYLLFELNCLFDKGRIVLKNSGLNLDFYAVKKSGCFLGYKELFNVRAPLPVNYKRSFMVDAVKHIVGCVKNGSISASSGEDGLATLKLIESALRSACSNGKRIFVS